MEILKNYSLVNQNTFGIDVKSKYYINISSEEELIEYLSSRELKNEKMLVLGGGSNILFTQDFNGVIVKNSIRGIEIIEENRDEILVQACAGEIWDDFVGYCIEKGWGGIENLSSIPGTVGAAPIQNIGAYGVELQDVFHSLECYLITANEKRIFTKDECGFGYRESIFKNQFKGDAIITKVVFKLKKSHSINIYYRDLKEYFQNKPEPDINDVRQAVIDIRNSKLPVYKKFGNAGSFFKNPKVSSEINSKIKKDFPDIKSNPVNGNEFKISAAWLIEKCGFKGKRINYVGTYKNHALIIVNYGGSSGNEILEFALKIQQAVKEKFDIFLEPEVNII